MSQHWVRVGNKDLELGHEAQILVIRNKLAASCILNLHETSPF